MDWKEVASMIGTWAPALGTALAPFTGGVSVLAGTAVGALGKMMGKKEGDTITPQEVADMIGGDPEWKLKIMQAEQSFQLALRDAEIKELNARLADTQDARKMRTEHERITGKSDLNLYILAWVVVTGFFGLLLAMLNITVPEDQNGVVFMLFGSLSTGFGQVLQFFFGSSKSSSDKTGLLSKAPPVK